MSIKLTSRPLAGDWRRKDTLIRAAGIAVTRCTSAHSDACEVHVDVCGVWCSSNLLMYDPNCVFTEHEHGSRQILDVEKLTKQKLST